MNRKQRLLLTLGLAVACVAATVTTALAVGADSAPGPVTRDRVSGHRAPAAAATDELADVAPKPNGGKVVCPGIILKVGPTVMLPCRRGAEIVEARSVEVDGRYCARVTYIAETGSPPRTETLCEGDVLQSEAKWGAAAPGVLRRARCGSGGEERGQIDLARPWQ